MTRNNKACRAVGLLVAVVVLAISSRAYAVLLDGSDNASASAYSDGWQNSDDGFITNSAAFGAWTLQTTGGTAGFFIGDSKNLSGGSGANINSSNSSFGMFGASGSQANAIRSFGGPLSVGHAFSIDLAVNFRNGFKGMDLRDSTDAAIFNFDVSNPGGGDDYRVQFATTGNGSIGNSYAPNTAFNLSFTQTSATGGTWKIARSGGVTDLDTGTYTGIPASFKLYVGNTDGGSPNDLYANNLSISAVPEASAFAAGILVTALVGLTYCMRSIRRQQLMSGS